MEGNKSIEIQVHESPSNECDIVTYDFDKAKRRDNEKNESNKICRVCLDSGNIPIFGDETLPDMSADIKEFGGIIVDSADMFPKFICASCSKLLEAAVVFRNTAKQSDEYLKSNQHYENTEDDVYEPLKYLKTEMTTDYDYNVATETETTVNIKDELTESFALNYQDISTDNDFLRDRINVSVINTNQILPNDENPQELLEVSNKYDCVTCELSFSSSQEQSKHKKSALHKGKLSNKIECEICSKEVSRAYYNRHMEMHSNESKDDKLQCPICNKSYSKTYFNYHITHSHNKEQKKTHSDRIECSICNKSYEKQYYKSHLAIHDDASSKYVCDTCGKSFIQQSAFKRHCLVHGSELAYKCSLCPYRGRHPGLVKTHMQTHTRDYQHRCMECPARFLTKSNLNKHLLRHKGPVDFKCETCKRGFYSKLELDRHFEADHLGVKNHICNICGKAFGYRNAMMSHQLKVHKREKLTNGKGRLPLYLEAERKNDNL